MPSFPPFLLFKYDRPWYNFVGEFLLGITSIVQSHVATDELRGRFRGDVYIYTIVGRINVRKGVRLYPSRKKENTPKLRRLLHCFPRRISPHQDRGEKDASCLAGDFGEDAVIGPSLRSKKRKKKKTRRFRAGRYVVGCYQSKQKRNGAERSPTTTLPPAPF